MHVLHEDNDMFTVYAKSMMCMDTPWQQDQCGWYVVWIQIMSTVMWCVDHDVV